MPSARLRRGRCELIPARHATPHYRSLTRRALAPAPAAVVSGFVAGSSLTSRRLTSPAPCPPSTRTKLAAGPFTVTRSTSAPLDDSSRTTASAPPAAGSCAAAEDEAVHVLADDGGAQVRCAHLQRDPAEGQPLAVAREHAERRQARAEAVDLGIGVGLLVHGRPRVLRGAAAGERRSRCSPASGSGSGDPAMPVMNTPRRRHELRVGGGLGLHVADRRRRASVPASFFARPRGTFSAARRGGRRSACGRCPS